MSLVESESGTEPKTRVCLNMIVRNEAHIVREVLDSVAPFIASWVIASTAAKTSGPRLRPSSSIPSIALRVLSQSKASSFIGGIGP